MPSFFLNLAFLAALAAPAAVVEEVTRLYPVRVERVAAPKTLEELRRLVRDNPGPISVGGGRYSMGGQTASPDGLQIDMREMDRVLHFSPAERTITVEAGITWRKIQEFVDPHDLSVKIMQSYANFTVGGALSVNAHGRYVNQGPVIRSARAITAVLADGSVVEASPAKRPDVFYGAIGGYGAIGVIATATLELEPNEALERTAKPLTLAEYPDWFKSAIKDSKAAVFHNADIYPPDYEKVMAVTYSRTGRRVTVPERLQPPYRPNWKDRLMVWWISERRYAKRLRAKAIDPMTLKRRPVVWRNYEASYDVGTLEPYSRAKSTYVLQEYFVPVGRFADFAPRMVEIFRRHRANVLNVSIRHAETDTGSVMAWARGETFAFVVYYKQGVSPAERGAVEVWTRELIDAAIASGGTYYLPYQVVARPDQFHAAYPRAKEFLALKKRLDPGHKFTNALWDAYLPRPNPRAAADAAIAAKLRARPTYARAEAQTFYTVPEWYIVYSTEELAALMARDLPSRFPYFAAIRQFWAVRKAMYRALAGYQPNSEYRTMIAMIGVSFTVEYALKGLYENTIGRLTERLTLTGDPARRGPADLAAATIQREYGAFMHDWPWYEFPFKTKLLAYRRDTAAAPLTVRSFERRLAVPLELAGKAIWAKIIKKATGTAYDPQSLVIEAWVRGEPKGSGVKVLERLGGGDLLVEFPRYEKFQGAAKAFVKGGGRFVEIAGNKTILATVLASESWDGARLWGGAAGTWPVLSEPGRVRVAVAVPVARLHEALAEWDASAVTVEHLYDY